LGFVPRHCGAQEVRPIPQGSPAMHPDPSRRPVVSIFESILPPGFPPQLVPFPKAPVASSLVPPFRLGGSDQIGAIDFLHPGA